MAMPWRKQGIDERRRGLLNYGCLGRRGKSLCCCQEPPAFQGLAAFVFLHRYLLVLLTLDKCLDQRFNGGNLTLTQIR